MTHIEINHIIIAIMDCKRKYFNEKYVTLEEANTFKDEIQKRFMKENIETIVDYSNIDESYFEVKDGIVFSKLWPEAKEHYKNITDLKTLKILLDEEYILNFLVEDSKQKIKKIENNINANNGKINLKNLLLEYQNKLNKMNKIEDPKSWEEDLKFSLSIVERYNFLTTKMPIILDKIINNIPLEFKPYCDINLPYQKISFDDLVLFKKFLITNSLGIIQFDNIIMANTDFHIKLFLSVPFIEVLETFYLELEKMEYLYYPEELRQTRSKKNF